MKRIILSLIVLVLAIISFIFSLGVYINKSNNKAEASVSVSVSAPEVSSEAETEEKIEYTFYDVPLDLDTQREIIDICSEYGLAYELILGICSVETDFRPNVIGDGGNSFGLMQIQPKWWSEIMAREGVTNLSDPLQNIRCGCAILNELKEKYRTEYRALQAYNTGNPNSCSGYAEKVYSRIGELKVYSEQNIGG